jgi:hypothetical protein
MVIMGWFALGIIFNLRRGDALLRWLQTGLPRIGERTTFRWLGSSVAELVIAKAKNPFRRLDTLIVLTPRDVPWMWFWARLRGRRDTLILRAHLAVAPRLDLELADPASWTGRTALEQVRQRGWESQPYADGLLLMAPAGLLNLAGSVASSLTDRLAQLSPKTYRLGLHKEAPHLELHIPFPDKQSDARQWFEALVKLAQLAGEAPQA